MFIKPEEENVPSTCETSHQVQADPRRRGRDAHLRRAFGFHGNTSEFDPFLLLDDFRRDVPEDYLAGFPWHPHRGIETVTYVLAGTVEHGDSMGNRGAIAAGEVQWMTAGSGIIRQEMPKGDQTGAGCMGSSCGRTAARFAQDDEAALSGGRSRLRKSPEITDDDGTHVRECLRRLLGQVRKPKWMESLPTRFTWMCR